MKPLLFVTLGFPGSGKTFFSRRLARDFKLTHLNSDKLRLEIFKKPKYSLEENKILFDKMDFLADRYLSAGKSVIYDANVTRRKFRNKLRKIADKHGAVYMLLRFQVSADVAINRIKERSKLKSKLLKKYYRPIDKSILFNIKKDIQEPKKREPHIFIDASRPYQEQLKTITKLLKK